MGPDSAEIDQLINNPAADSQVSGRLSNRDIGKAVVIRIF